jgi:hypothetical protein
MTTGTVPRTRTAFRRTTTLKTPYVDEQSQKIAIFEQTNY